MRAFAKKLRVLLAVQYAYMLEYRGEIFLWIVVTVLPLIMLGPWMAAGASGRFPLDEREFARYFVAVFVVRQFSLCWVIYEFEGLVVSGRLSPQLLLPIDPAWRYIAAHVSEFASRAPFVLAITLVVVAMFPAAVTADDGGWLLPGPGAIALAVIATASAFALRFLMQYSLSMGALWIERISAFDRLQMLPYLFLSGLVAPLEVFPERVREIVLWTPFPYLVWFPARLLAGGDVGPPWRAVLIVAGWSLAFWLLLRMLWRRGLRHYSAMGA